MSVSNIKQERTDMIKKIVMGPYYKYDENSPWFSYEGRIGEVRVIEDTLCHAVRDIECFTEEHDLCTREGMSNRIIRWETVSTPMIKKVTRNQLDSKK